YDRHRPEPGGEIPLRRKRLPDAGCQPALPPVHGLRAWHRRQRLGPVGRGNNLVQRRHLGDTPVYQPCHTPAPLLPAYSRCPRPASTSSCVPRISSSAIRVWMSMGRPCAWRATLANRLPSRRWSSFWPSSASVSIAGPEMVAAVPSRNSSDIHESALSASKVP